MSSSVHDVSSDLHNVDATSEAHWEGTAAEKFRQTNGKQADNADQLAEKITQVQTAVKVFAGELRTVKQRIESARGVAAGGGCELTPDGIIDPGPAPQPTGLASASTPVPPEKANAHADAVNAHQAAVAEHQNKVNAFQEAKQTVDDMRNTEIDAHNKLGHALQSFQLREFNDAKTTANEWVSDTLGGVRALKTGADELFAHSQTMAQSAAKQAQGWLGWWNSIGPRADAMASKAAGYAVSGPLKVLPQGLVKAIDADPLNTLKNKSTTASNLENASKANAGVGKGLKFGARAIKNVPLVGTGVTALSGAIDYADGSKSAAQATGETAGTVAGAAGGGAALSFIPVVGTSIGSFAGGWVGGKLGSWVGSWFD